MTLAPRNHDELEAEDELLAWAFPSQPRKLTDPEIQGLLSESPHRVFRASAVADDYWGDRGAEDDLDREMTWRERERWL